MANTVIHIKRSYQSVSPGALKDGELAYSFVSNTLWIGNQSNTPVIITDAAARINSTYGFIQANSAYASQNTTGVYANAAFLQANSAYESQNTTGDYANSAFLQANAAYDSQNTTGIYANSAYASQNTTGIYANSAFLKANAAYDSQNTTGIVANAAFIEANSAYESQNTTGVYANAAFLKANAAYESQNTTGAYTNVVFQFANSAGQYANAAFAVANTALQATGGTISGSLTINKDVTVQGNLSVLGNSTIIYTSALDLTDSLIYLANGNYISDAIDIGFIGHYNDGTQSHTGLFRDPNLKEYIFFKGYTPEVESNNLINIAHPSFTYANVYADNFKGNVFANKVTATNTAIGALNTSSNVNFYSTVNEQTEVLHTSNRSTGFFGFAATDSSRFAELLLMKSTTNGYGLANEAVVRASGSTAGLTLSSSSGASPQIRFITGPAGFSSEQFRVNNTNTAVNYIAVTGGIAGNTTTISTAGSDTNVSLLVQPKGTGAFDIQTTSNVNIGAGTTVTGIQGTNGGTNYTSIPSVVITPPQISGGTTATATAAMAVSTYTITSGGTGYAVNDVITGVGGTFTTAWSFTVSAVSAGVITGLTVSNGGTYTVLPVGAQTVTGGTGTGAQITVNTWQVRATAFTITNAGSGYVESPAISFSGGAGSGAAAYAQIGSTPTIRSINGNLNLQTAAGLALQLYESPLSAPIVNYWSIRGATTTNGPVLFANGSDTNVNGTFSSKGTGGLYFYTNSTGSNQFAVAHTASAVNYVQVTGGSTGNQPIISAQGSDANIFLALSAKGTGPVRTTSNFQAATSFANWFQFNGASTLSSPLFSVQGLDTNIDLTVAPKGSGAILVGQTYNHSPNNANTVLQVTGNVFATGTITSQNIVVQGGTNYLIQSSNLQNSVWTTHAGDTTFTTVTANTTILAPDGTTTAWQLNNTGGQTQTNFGIFQSTGKNSLASIGPWTGSVWLRAGSLTTCQFYLSGGADDVAIAGGVLALTQGWQRYTLSGFSNKSTLDVRLQLSTNGVAGSILVWGPQIEQSLSAGPYVATGASSITASNTNIYVPYGTTTSNNIVALNRLSLANANNISVISQIYNASTNSLDVVFN